MSLEIIETFHKNQVQLPWFLNDQHVTMYEDVDSLQPLHITYFRNIKYHALCILGAAMRNNFMA